ncbi:MAG: Rieske (2Fe-2S) protein [Bacteroidetes bacterium]|nr:Rieske (2Fe-2S) protein [Bacteroidota bacterium]
MSGAFATTLLESCVSAAYVAKSTFSGNKISIAKTEFQTENNKSRKFILIRNEKFQMPIVLYALENSQYSALLTECTHKGCEVKPQGDFLVCPCHGSEFSKTGEVQNPPAENPLRSFKTNSDEKNIYIYL